MQCDLEMTKQSGTHTQLHMASFHRSGLYLQQTCICMGGTGSSSTVICFVWRVAGLGYPFFSCFKLELITTNATCQ